MKKGSNITGKWRQVCVCVRCSAVEVEQHAYPVNIDFPLDQDHMDTLQICCVKRFSSVLLVQTHWCPSVLVLLF